MRTLFILSSLCLILGTIHAAEIAISGTDWAIDEINEERIRLISENEEKNVALFITRKGEAWRLAIATPHFIYDTELGAMGVLVKLNSHKPFSITNRSKRTILKVKEFDKNLFFGWSSDDSPVRWLADRESIIIEIPEMGNGSKEYILPVRGVKTAMLEAQQRQRNQ